MNLHEYQAKELLRKFNLPLLKGKSYIDNLKSIEKETYANMLPPLELLGEEKKNEMIKQISRSL